MDKETKMAALKSLMGKARAASAKKGPTLVITIGHPPGDEPDDEDESMKHGKMRGGGDY
jgi:hypothetical protein